MLLGDRPEIKEAVYLLLGFIVGIGALLLAFLAAFQLSRGALELAPGYNLPSILFSAASLALLIVSIFLGVVALFGWRSLQRYVDRRVEDRVGRMHQEHKAGLKLTAGVFWGRTAREDAPDATTIEKPDLFQNAIDKTREALDLTQDEGREWLLKNNLAFYLALDGDPSYAETVADLARELLDRHAMTGNPEYMNTYARAVLSFPEEFGDREEAWKGVREQLERLARRRDVPESAKANARRHIHELDRALANLKSLKDEN